MFSKAYTESLRLRAEQGFAHQKARGAASAAKEADQRAETAERRADSLSAQLATATKAQKTAEQAVDNALQAQSHQLEAARAKDDDLSSEIQQLQRELMEAREEAAAKQAVLEAETAAAVDSERHRSDEQLHQLQGELETVSSSIVRLSQQASDGEAVQVKLQKCETQLMYKTKAWNHKEAQLNLENKRLKSLLSDAQSTITGLEKGAKVPASTRDPTAALNSAVEAAEKRLSEKHAHEMKRGQQAAVGLRKQLGVSNNSIDKLRQELVSIKKKHATQHPERLHASSGEQIELIEQLTATMKEQQIVVERRAVAADRKADKLATQLAAAIEAQKAAEQAQHEPISRATILVAENRQLQLELAEAQKKASGSVAAPTLSRDLAKSLKQSNAAERRVDSLSAQLATATKAQKTAERAVDNALQAQSHQLEAARAKEDDLSSENQQLQRELMEAREAARVAESQAAENWQTPRNGSNLSVHYTPDTSSRDDSPQSKASIFETPKGSAARDRIERGKWRRYGRSVDAARAKAEDEAAQIRIELAQMVISKTADEASLRAEVADVLATKREAEMRLQSTLATQAQLLESVRAAEATARSTAQTVVARDLALAALEAAHHDELRAAHLAHEQTIEAAVQEATAEAEARVRKIEQEAAKEVLEFRARSMQGRSELDTEWQPRQDPLHGTEHQLAEFTMQQAALQSRMEPLTAQVETSRRIQQQMAHANKKLQYDLERQRREGAEIQVRADESAKAESHRFQDSELQRSVQATQELQLAVGRVEEAAERRLVEVSQQLVVAQDEARQEHAACDEATSQLACVALELEATQSELSRCGQARASMHRTAVHQHCT
jgi:hypothetical protein